MQIEQRLAELGLSFPKPLLLPPGVTLPFPWVNVRGDRAFISGHIPQELDGAPAGPFGRIGEAVSRDDGYLAAQKIALAMLGSLKRELGDLDRVAGWCRVHGMINCAPGFADMPFVINGFSNIILDVFGEQVGRHARTAVGAAGLPLGAPVEVEAEVLLS